LFVEHSRIKRSAPELATRLCGDDHRSGISLQRTICVSGRDQSGGAASDGTSFYDIIDGKGGNDSLYGNEGDDRITGGAGDDEIEAGDGEDTVVFSGMRSDYVAFLSRLDEITIFDQRTNSNDGTDKVVAADGFNSVM
jgi:Ca2+-binding RTX toxin-like protein